MARPAFTRFRSSWLLLWIVCASVPSGGAEIFRDNFDRDEGPVDGWVAHAGAWYITSEDALSTVTAGQEHWLWAGDPPEWIVGENLAIEFDMEFLAAPADGVGRHAGIFFFASAPTHRWEISGYDVWWIDRGQDFGISIRRWDGGVLTFLTPGTFGAIGDPLLLQRP